MDFLLHILVLFLPVENTEKVLNFETPYIFIFLIFYLILHILISWKFDTNSL